jgi:predicted aspartyl protease
LIQGRVSGLHATVRVLIRSPLKSSAEVEFVIDTGFEGALAMPPDVVAELGLPYFEEMKAKLANSSLRQSLARQAS